MRAAILLLLPFLGSCRNLTPREASELERDAVFDGAASVCYSFTSTYYVTVTDNAPGPGERILSIEVWAILTSAQCRQYWERET